MTGLSTRTSASPKVQINSTPLAIALKKKGANAPLLKLRRRAEWIQLVLPQFEILLGQRITRVEITRAMRPGAAIT